MKENKEAYFYCPACKKDSITVPEDKKITCPKCSAVWLVELRYEWTATVRIDLP